VIEMRGGDTTLITDHKVMVKDVDILAELKARLAALERR
jgi:hypothetical protein